MSGSHISPRPPQPTGVSRRKALLMLSSAAALAGCGGGAGVSAIASQDLGKITWSSAVDLAPQYTPGGALLTHYGSPVVTIHNTIVIPVKSTATGGYRIEGRDGGTGALAWSLATDYVTPPHNWVPPYNVLLTPQGRVYAPAAGGKVVVRDDPETIGGALATHVFYGAAAYNANPAAFDATVFINTPLTADAQGNVFFGFQVTGANPAGLVSGIARITPGGTGTWVGAAAAAGDPAIQKPAMNCAPALSSDGSTVYIAVNIALAPGVVQRGYLLALDSTTLATKAKVALTDPNSNTPARISDDATSTPVVAPDGRVFYGVLESQFPTHNARGWLLQFDSSLAPAGVPGSFGWDVSPSVIPASMVPSYVGPSTYLLAQKYNNYIGAGTGNGLNRMAVLDPKTSQADPVVPSVQVMREVLTILAPTQDGNTTGRKEWCINTMAADPPRKSVLANNEDGILYRWDLTTNTLSQALQLNSGPGQPYPPTIAAADGAVYAISNAILYSIRTS
jgi:hypothetical protein